MSLIKSLSPKLIKNRFLLVKSYLRGESLIKGFPIELSIELTNHCNADCIMCPRHKMSRKKGFMAFDLFKKIVDEAKNYTELVSLHLAGEPLLHPELTKMITYCGKIGLKTTFSTNATLLDAAKCEALLKTPLDLLTLSFDGVAKETYEKIRRSSDFDSTYDNIQRFLHMKEKSRISPYTVIQLVYMKDNFNEAKSFIAKWRKAKVDAVRIKPYLNYPGLDNYLGELPRRQDTDLRPCILLWRQLTIYWDGMVVSCCQDFLSQMVVGDVNQETIESIWNGERMTRMREVHTQKLYRNLTLCKDCTVPQLGLLLLLGTLFFDDLAIKKILPKIEQFVILNNVQGISYFS